MLMQGSRRSRRRFDSRVVRVHRELRGVDAVGLPVRRALLALQALNAAQLAKVLPSAGGWYT
jgi:hypothetical protein